MAPWTPSKEARRASVAWGLHPLDPPRPSWGAPPPRPPEGAHRAHPGGNLGVQGTEVADFHTNLALICHYGGHELTTYSA